MEPLDLLMVMLLLRPQPVEDQHSELRSLKNKRTPMEPQVVLKLEEKEFLVSVAHFEVYTLSVVGIHSLRILDYLHLR